MSKDPAESSGRALLPRWANNHDGWCRTIVADILKSGSSAANSDIDRYLKLLLSEKKLSDDAVEEVPKIEEKEVDANPLEPVCLDSLRIEGGVNAIKPGVEITFGPGITIVFGENGAGKSGFVRVLKRAAGVRTAEDILPNVLANASTKPSGTFTVTVGKAQQTVAWKDEFGVAPLNRVSVFDARGARLHLEEDLTYVYTPGELTLFPLVQNAIERVRTAFDAAITGKTPAANTIVNSFDRASSIYSSIETLGAATDLEEIRKYAILPENVDVTIESLTTEIAALRSSNLQNELKRTRDRLAVVTALKIAVDTGKKIDPVKYDSLLNVLSSTTKRRDEAGAKAFEGLEIPGVLTNEWQQFIQAGEDYLQKHLTATYPSTADECAYCRQPLIASAVSLVKKYRAFCSDEIKVARDVAERELSSYVASILDLHVEVVQRQLASEANDPTDVLASTTQIIEQINKFKTAITSLSTFEWEDRTTALDEAYSIVSAEHTRLTALISQLQNSAAVREAALKTKQNELVELQARKLTNALLPQIEARVSDAKWVARATIVKNNFTGVLRSLTEAAKQASEQLLNKDFEKRFEEECRWLRAPHVTLNFPGRQGQATRRKLVASHKPSEILSEGEQKALALADFLTEVTSVPAASPVIFDDPITSMDYRRIHEVSDRVLTLAQDHQVIVFTHNIWFAAELLGKADKKRAKYYDIRCEGSDAGILTEAFHPRVDTMAQANGRVKRIIEAAEKQQGEVKVALVEKGYEELRGLCELIVEQEMLKGVTQRYAPNVMMTKLDKINVAELQDSITAMMPVFERACRYIASHSQPMETQGIRPTLEELKNDYDMVLKAREPHKA
jgi:ABC-type cobalamin/Fe3+-siderophores transport system ATPase subunit